LRLIVLGLYLIAPDCARCQVRTHAVVNQSEMTLDAAALAADLSEALQLQAEGGASAQLLAMEATLREQQDQLAALEASTQCLILTGVGEPLPQLINRAEELEVPLLKVEHDTLTTVEVIEQAFGHVRLHEGVKATYAIRLVDEHCDFGPLFTRLQVPRPA
jgi:hypothetical protein